MQEVFIVPNKATSDAIKQQLLNNTPLAICRVLQLRTLIANIWQQLRYAENPVCFKDNKPIITANQIQLNLLAFTCLQSANNKLNANQPNNQLSNQLGNSDLKKLVKPFLNAYNLCQTYGVTQKDLDLRKWDFEMFHLWLQLFNNKLDALNLITYPQQLELILKYYNNNHLKITLCNFAAISKLEQKVIAALDSNYQTIELKQTLATTKLKFEAADANQQLNTALHWASAIYQNHKDAKIAIIVNNLSANREFVRRIVTNYDDSTINIAGGSLLKDNPAIAQVTVVLKIFNKRLDYKQLQACFQLPLWQFKTATNRYLLLNKIQNRSQFFYSTHQTLNLIAKYLDSAQVEALKTYYQLIFKKHSTTAWLQNLQQLLINLNWQFQGGFAFEFEKWQQLDSICNSLTKVKPDLNFSDWQYIWQLLLEQNIAQPIIADKINIVDTIDGTLGFSHIWFCDADTDNWPPKLNPNTILPIDFQRQFAMPRSDWNLEFEAVKELLTRIQKQCNYLVVSCCAQDNADFVPLFDNFADFEESKKQTETPSPIKLQEFEDEPPPPISRRERKTITGGSSLMESICLSNFYAFVRHRLQANVLQEIPVGYSALDQGSLVHEILESFYSEFLNSNLNTQTIWQPQLEQLINEKLETANCFRLLPIQQKIAAKLLLTILTNAITTDIELLTTSGYKITETEYTTKLQIAELLINLRIDRIDSNFNKLRIVDYKTGLALPSLKQIVGLDNTNITKPQLALYALAQQHPESVAELVFFNINIKNTKVVNVLDKINISDYLPQWRTYFTDIVTSYFAGDISHNNRQPLPKQFAKVTRIVE